jgi:hypothetical protein
MLAKAARLQSIVQRLSPTTKVTIPVNTSLYLVTHLTQPVDTETDSSAQVNVDEIGSLYGCGDVFGADRFYFNAIGAVYAFVYAELAEIGVEIMAASQLTG